MKMSSSREVPASVETTWRALNDPDVLKACIPGCESIERVTDNEYRVAMTARVGPVSARFTGRIVLSDIVAPTSYKMNFDGQGGAAGFANGETRVTLVAQGAGTRIDYSAKAQVGGKLAQIGSRLIDGAAAKVADDFFARFVEQVGGTSEGNTEVQAPAPAQVHAVWGKMWIRLALAAAIVVVMTIYWLTRPA